MASSAAAANPLFQAAAASSSSTSAAPPLDLEDLPLKAKSQHHVMVGRMSRGLELVNVPVDTTLGEEDWDLIEDDLLPFQIVVFAVSLGGVALFALGIHMMAAPNHLVDFTQTFAGVFAYLDTFLVLLFTLPIFVGAFQVVLALGFSLAATAEKWAKVSIQDMVMYVIPKRFTTPGLRHVRLHCTARKAYMWTMVLFLLLQTICAGIALGVNDFVDSAVNQGSGAGASDGMMRTVLDYSSAVFNTCCHDQGWSKQGPILACAPGTSQLLQCTFTEARFQQLQGKLCACHVTAPAEFARYMHYVNNSRVCDVSRQLDVRIAKGQLIPGTEYPFRTLVPAAFASIPVVGNPNTHYGCGLGTLRGFQWSLVQWCTAELRPYFVGILAISAIQIVLLALGASVVCKVKRERVVGEDGNVMYVDKRDADGARGWQRLLLVQPTFKFGGGSGGGGGGAKKTAEVASAAPSTAVVVAESSSTTTPPTPTLTTAAAATSTKAQRQEMDAYKAEAAALVAAAAPTAKLAPPRQHRKPAGPPPPTANNRHRKVDIDGVI